jgi:hypothetical protein
LVPAVKTVPSTMEQIPLVAQLQKRKQMVGNWLPAKLSASGDRCLSRSSGLKSKGNVLA